MERNDTAALQNRPILKLKKTAFEITLNMLSLLLFIGSMVYLAVIWASLPDKVPTHFNLAGEANGWGHKGTLLLLPMIGFVVWIGFTLLERVPHVYNYTGLTEENAERQYKNARTMMNVLKNEIMIIFVYLSWESVQLIYGRKVGFGVWDIAVLLIIIVSSLAFFIRRSIRLR